MVPEERARHKAQPLGEIVPALQRVWQVTVELLPDVLDTEAKTIETDMRHAHVPALSLRQARTFLVRTAGGPEEVSSAESARRVTAYAKETLHNAVMEHVRVEVVQ
jgi:phosphoribosylformylglycinamidine (FGAM) synthase PurS component